MTKEDAIKRIKRILEECKEYNEDDEIAVCYVTSYDADALHMAVKTIEQEPCEDAVTPVKTGQWVFIDKAHEHAYCSECGYGNVDLFNGRPHNYCPNCGAKMDEEEEKK